MLKVVFEKVEDLLRFLNLLRTMEFLTALEELIEWPAEVATFTAPPMDAEGVHWVFILSEETSEVLAIGRTDGEQVFTVALAGDEWRGVGLVPAY